MDSGSKVGMMSSVIVAYAAIQSIQSLGFRLGGRNDELVDSGSKVGMTSSVIVAYAQSRAFNHLDSGSGAGMTS